MTRSAAATRWTSLGLVVLVVAVFVALPAISGPARPERVVEVPGGDAARGSAAFVDYGCHSCHRIPGVQGADSLVAPPLDAWGERSFVAGRLPNTPDAVMTWIMDPQEIDPGNAMPDMGVPESVARDMAAYLFELRG
jgi:cytochrome c